MLLTLNLLRIHLRGTKFTTLYYLELLLSSPKSQMPAYPGIEISIPTTKWVSKSFISENGHHLHTCAALARFFSITCERPHNYIFYFLCPYKSIILKVLKAQFSYVCVCERENISQSFIQHDDKADSKQNIKNL